MKELQFRIHVKPHQARQLSRMFTRMGAEGYERARQATRAELRGIIRPDGRITDRGLPPLGGDVTGTLSANLLTSLRGRVVSALAPTVGQALIWTGAAWAPGNVAPATRWEPVTNGDPTTPEIVFDDGDVVMEEVPL